MLSFEFDFEVAQAALLYLAGCELPDFDKYRAAKLIFLADREHLLRFGRPITGDTYSAMPYGPTPDRILDLLNGLEMIALEGADPMSDEVAELARGLKVSNIDHPVYRAQVSPDMDYLAQTDVIVLDAVASEYGRKSFEELKTFAHGLKAYTDVWRPDSLRKRFPISFEMFFADAPDAQELLHELGEQQRILEAVSKSASPVKVMSAH